ncbi:MAG: zinc ribbon domain-containing protein [Puniceicoccales bacterium]|nr:zinc ribbon domain-containing protein [Puniceicoccales bacterium]
MPLYEYECIECHKVSELLITASRPPICPHCGSVKLEKQLSLFASSGGVGSGHVHSGSCGCGHAHGQCCGGHGHAA